MNITARDEYVNTTKVISTPMTRGAYNTHRGWTLPEGENANDEGYLLEHLSDATSNHSDHTGYINWVTKDFFHASYKLIPAVKISNPSLQVAYADTIQQSDASPPRVTPQDVDNAISSVIYIDPYKAFTADADFAVTVEDAEQLKRLTLCVLVLKNGYTVTGESSCVDLRNFNAEIGRQVALENAKAKIWPLLGYQLRSC